MTTFTTSSMHFQKLLLSSYSRNNSWRRKLFSPNLDSLSIYYYYGCCRRRSLVSSTTSSTTATATATARTAGTGVRGENPDYVIVGAGSAGCVVAARLVEAGHSVTILEAGNSDRSGYFRDLFVHMPYVP